MFLVGRMTERVKQFGHDKLSVFGIGRELNEKAVGAPPLRQLVCHGSSSNPKARLLARLKLTESPRAGVFKKARPR